MSKQKDTFQRMHPCGITQMLKKQRKRDNLWKIHQELGRNENTYSIASREFGFDDDCFEYEPYSKHIDSIYHLEYDIDDDDNLIEINTIGINTFTRYIKNLSSKKTH